MEAIDANRLQQAKHQSFESLLRAPGSRLGRKCAILHPIAVDSIVVARSEISSVNFAEGE